MFKEKHKEYFHSRWVAIQRIIAIQQEILYNTGCTILRIGSILRRNAHALHVEWETQVSAGYLPQSWVTSQNRNQIRLRHKVAWDVAYAQLELDQYEMDIRDMCMKIQIPKDIAQATGVARKQLILDWQQMKILLNIYSLNLTGNIDD
jgi:hypothetical protein